MAVQGNQVKRVSHKEIACKHKKGRAGNQSRVKLTGMRVMSQSLLLQRSSSQHSSHPYTFLFPLPLNIGVVYDDTRVIGYDTVTYARSKGRQVAMPKIALLLLLERKIRAL